MSDQNVGVEGRIVKMEVDYSSTCDEKIPECSQMAKHGKLHDAIDALLVLEKQTRTGADMVSTGRVLVAVVQICYEAQNWTALNDNIILLTKRRSQLKQAVTKMVQQCCSYVDNMPNKETQLKLIDTLRSVTEGKIYVEVERARLTLKLAQIKEEERDIETAASILQELQVETYGSMQKREKVELILEQMRLCLAKKDYIRTQIISKKINIKFFEEPDTCDLKLKYYRLMIELDVHESSYLSVCKHYRAILATSSVQEDPEQAHMALQNVVLYLILAPYDNEQSDLTHRVLEEKQLDELPHYKQLLKLLTTDELIKWSDLITDYEKLLKEGDETHPPTDVFSVKDDEGSTRWQHLRSRVVQHNIRVMSKYYTRITVKRMAQLLDMTQEETEETLSDMVVNGSVEAKTDRPAGVVVFSRSKLPDDVLNEWAGGLAQLMKLVNNTTHLINKEHMIHKHLTPPAHN